MRTFKYYAGGKWLEPQSGKHLQSDNPYTGQPWASIPRCGRADVALAVNAAHGCFTSGPWARMNAAGRGRLLHRLADVLSANAEMLAEIETTDNGKRTRDILPGLQGWLADSFHYYAGLADKLEGAVIPVDAPDILNYTRPEPFGVVAAITAWNSPLLIAIWKLAPALAAGNTVVLKPSEHASASTLALMEAFEQADLPPGLINVVTGLGVEAGEPLVDHPLVRMVSFTGSVAGGRRVAEVAARQVKPVVMELGGKSPQIVFEDAPFDDAVHGVAGGIFPPAGQSCIAGSRLLVHEDLHGRFVDRLVDVVSGARLGDPCDPEVDIGPLANKPHYERVLSDINSALEEGARLRTGGSATYPDNTAGWFVEPTLFTEVKPSMRLAQEEIFGPVLAVIPFADEDEATTIANDTLYGLAAGIWTGDHGRAIRLAERIEAGTVYINNYFNATTQSPVGGFKQSGYGRENGIEGLRAFTQTKSVWLSTAGGVPNPFGHQP